jgi:hypothetical protein
VIVLKTTDERDDIEFERILAAKCKEISNNGDVKFCDTFDCFACPMFGSDGCIDRGDEKVRSMTAKAWLYDHGFLKDDL